MATGWTPYILIQEKCNEYEFKIKCVPCGKILHDSWSILLHVSESLPLYAIFFYLFVNIMKPWG